MTLRLNASRVPGKRNEVIRKLGASGTSLEDSCLSGHEGEETFSQGQVSESRNKERVRRGQ